MITGRRIGGRHAAAPRFCRTLFVMAFVGTTVVTACHRDPDAAPGIIVKEEIGPRPVRTGPATLSVELSDLSQKAISHASIMVEADMAHPGMSPVFTQATETAPGSYRAPIDFNMGGDWVLLLHIRLAGGRKIEHQMDVKGVQPD